jgi:hypothetical protein
VHYVNKICGYIVTNGFGGGGQSARNWSPKKAQDKRFLGKPGEVKREGNKETKIGDDGKAIKERHNTDHGTPNKHTNPHDHDIDWSKGYPDPGPPINYPGDVPDFKNYKGVTVVQQKGYFSSEDEFAESLKWNEHNFEYLGKIYWITVAGSHGERLVYEVGNEQSEQKFSSPTEVMNYEIDGKRIGNLVADLTFIF